MVGKVETRRVEPRNTPTVINAVFNFRNFWDGRANNVFNGVTPFGPHDEGAKVRVDDWYTPTERRRPSAPSRPSSASRTRAPRRRRSGRR